MDDRRSATQPEDILAPHAGRRRLFAFAASIAAHALTILAIGYFAAPVVRPRTNWIILHVGDPGTGADTKPRASGRGAALARLEAPKSARTESNRARPKAPALRHIARANPPSHPHKRPPHRTLARNETLPANRAALDGRAPDRAVRKTVVANVSSTPNPVRAASVDGAGGLPDARPPSQAIGGASAGNGNAGRGLDGHGSGTGAGTTSAYARYGENPVPEYPDEARRNNEQGTVLLRVLVDIDGSVKRVEIAQSSGFAILDDAARETVIERWRFVPARRGGIAVKSWVRIPIRFALTEADASF